MKQHRAAGVSATGNSSRRKEKPEQVADEIRATIIAGEIADGEMLGHETALIERFEVSRPTLRESLRILETEGLVEVIRGVRGGVVVRLPDETVTARAASMLLSSRGVPLADVHAGVRLRMGTGDRAAGLAWRVQDAGTYYAARLDLDDRELVLYKFVRGNRVRLNRLTDLRLAANRWYNLLVEHRGTSIRVWLNGIPVARAEDDSVTAAGSLGFWMPGDGTAAFERLWYRPMHADAR